MFTTSQQNGAAVDLAALATAAATKTAHASGSLIAVYKLAFLSSTGPALFAAVRVGTQLHSHACQRELARQQAVGEAPGSQAESMLRC